MKLTILKKITISLFFLVALFFVAARPSLAYTSWEECNASGCTNCIIQGEREDGSAIWACGTIPPGEGVIQNPVAPGLSPGTQMQAVDKFSALLQTVIGVLIIGASVAFFFVFLIGAIKWITSSGDKAQIESARGTIVNALIGLVIALSLFAIIKLIETIFGFDILQIHIGALKIK